MSRLAKKKEKYDLNKFDFTNCHNKNFNHLLGYIRYNDDIPIGDTSTRNNICNLLHKWLEAQQNVDPIKLAKSHLEDDIHHIRLQKAHNMDIVKQIDALSPTITPKQRAHLLKDRDLQQKEIEKAQEQISGLQHIVEQL